MKQSRDSTLHMAIAGRQLAQWDGESRMANAGPLLDAFALAEGHPTPDVSAMLEQASAKRLQGVRTVLVTTRTHGSAPGAELRRLVASATAANALGSLEMVEADFVRLQPVFEFV
jgi:hypothetical protein